jgi:Tfp pilus assembly protein PilX
MRTGFVLPACLVLLLILMLVATGTLRSATLESQMASNAAERREVFDTSESVRRLCARMGADGSVRDGAGQ